MSKRKVVSLGGEGSNRLLDLLEDHRHTTSMEEFMEGDGTPPALVSERYLLLVGQGHLRSTDRREMAAILRAKANRIPIVVENFTKEDFKSLTGLSLKSEAAVVQFSRGGRAQTITLIDPPQGGHTMESALDAVNRAIDKNMHTFKAPGADPTRQAYAANIWTIWLHTVNVVCTLPYYAPEDTYYPQTSNLDFGVQMTLVAQNDGGNKQKAINLQYLGAGFSPLSPIESNDYFKGARTLNTTYAGRLTAPIRAMLTGTADTVEPKTASQAHTVTKTNGFTWGLGSSCGANISGPNCSISANFNFSETTQNTQTIAERVIDATSSFQQVPDPTGSICGDTLHGCWQAKHGVQYTLSSTATSDGGLSVDLPGNHWNNFFDDSQWGNGGFDSTDEGDAIYTYCNYYSCDADNPPPLSEGKTVRDWPEWSKNAALTEGEAGYTFSPEFNGDLTLTATTTAEEGIFTIGMGPKNGRLPNEFHNNCVGVNCSPYVNYLLDLYTDTVSKTASIAIDASQVNYSGMPTCAMRQYSQSDLGIYEVANLTNSVLSISQMAAYPFQQKMNTVADDYRGSADFLVGVSATTVQPGQHEYVALCSATQTATPAMALYYDNGSGVSGMLTFDGAGQPLPNNSMNISYNPNDRTFTINP